MRLPRLLLVLLAAAPAVRAAELTLSHATVADLQAAMEAGALTSEKLLQLYLARVERYEADLNAVITLNPRALDEARALDTERKTKGPRSPLHGIPIGSVQPTASRGSSPSVMPTSRPPAPSACPCTPRPWRAKRSPINFAARLSRIARHLSARSAGGIP